VLALGILALSGWLLSLSFRGAWHLLVNLNPQLAGALVAAIAAIIGATVTVMLGRYFERKREIESHFRTRKIEIYDRLLVELFKTFHEDAKGDSGSQNIAEFLREWQRTVLLVGWG